MDVIVSFEYLTELELAIKKLEKSGIVQEDIISIPLDERLEETQSMDTIHHSDGVSLLDLGMVLGCIFMLLGSIYGFILKWGPIIWGLIGLILGLLLGIIIKWFFLKKRTLKKNPTRNIPKFFFRYGVMKSNMKG